MLPLGSATWYPRTHNDNGSLNEAVVQAIVKYLCDDPANPNDTDTPVYERGVAGEADYSWFRTHPFEPAFSLGMDDVAAFDHTLWAEGASDRYYRFVARVAEEVARYHPDRRLGVLLYQNAREPFTDAGLRLPDNVYGYLTQSTAQWWEPARDASGRPLVGPDGRPLTVGDLDRQTTATWAGKMPHLLRYDYPALATITPQVFPRRLAESLAYDVQAGLDDGVYYEMAVFHPHADPMVWATAQLLWDRSAPIDALLDAYYAKAYGGGETAAAMAGYVLEAGWTAARPARKEGWVHGDLAAQADAMTAAQVDEALSLLATAADREFASPAAEVDPRVLERIAMNRKGMEYSAFVIREKSLADALRKAVVGDAAAAEAAARAVELLGQLAAARGPVWQAAYQGDDLLGRTLRGLDAANLLVAEEVSGIEGEAFAASVRVLEWHRLNAPERLDALTARLTRPQLGPVADMLRTWLARGSAANLVRDGGFEASYPYSGAATGWEPLPRRPDTLLYTAAGAGVNGSVAAVIEGTRLDVTSFHQRVRATGGRRYLITADVRLGNPEVGLGTLHVRLLRSNNTWSRNDFLINTRPGVSGWQTLGLYVTVPAGTAPDGLRVLLKADEQLGAPDAAHQVFFDNVAVYEIGP